MHFDMSQVDRLASDLAKAPAKVQSRKPQVLHSVAEEGARIASIIAPKLTGFLSENIEVHLASYTATARYAAYVEYGTSDTAPQPFMRPSADAVIPKLADGMGDAAEDIL